MIVSSTSNFVGLLLTCFAHSYRIVPTSERYSPFIWGTILADSLAAGSTVMNGQTGTKKSLTHPAFFGLIIWNPICWLGRILYHAWKNRNICHTFINHNSLVTIIRKQRKKNEKWGPRFNFFFPPQNHAV